MRKSLFAGLASALVVAAISVTASASPKTLYTALLTSAYPDSQLPSGFASAKVGLAKPTSKAQQHHVVGEVSVSVNGPDPDDAIFYAVFTKPSDAQADLAGASPPGSVHVQGKVPGYKLPSIWFTGSITGKNALGKTITNGITVLAVADSSVLVGAVTDSSDNTVSGNVPAALALLKSALVHLDSVETRLSGGGGASSGPPLALPQPIDWVSLPGLQMRKPPWPNDSDTLGTRLPALGLHALSHEELAFHIHQHLDIYVDGKHVTVPQEIGFGINPATNQPQFITELHTHRTDGIIHVESAQVLRYVLGQFFGEWGVRLTSTCLGSFKGSCDNLRWWVNGAKQTGNPASLVLRNHQEIVISIGRPPARVPRSFDFAAHGV